MVAVGVAEVADTHIIKRATWKAELREALLEGSKSVERVSTKDIVRTVEDVRRRRRKVEPTVVAEAVEATT